MLLLSCLWAALLAASCASAHVLTPDDYAAAVRNWRTRARRGHLAARAGPSTPAQTGYRLVYERYTCPLTYTGADFRGQTRTVSLSSCA